MCDTLCVVGSDRTLFAKNSDRPPDEAQVVESHPARPGGGSLRTTYLDIDDTGAHAVVGSRPTWMWGFEHGVNEHRVAIGNERIFTTDDPHAAPPSLTGMDLVRLALERADTADVALDVLVDLLERHGQGGSGEQDRDDPYWSSFLVADPRGAWVLETSGRTWAARPVEHGAAISNRVTIGTDWTRSSGDVATGTDFDEWRDPGMPTEVADRRLAVTGACVATGAAALTPADLVTTLRHHGTRPWGTPGRHDRHVEPPPPRDAPGWEGVSVCWHGAVTTTAAMVVELPGDPAAPARAWFALGSPCASVFVPTVPPAVPTPLADPATWERFAALRRQVEADPARLGDVRAALATVEDALWSAADADGGAWDADAAWAEVDSVLGRLGV